MVELRLVLDRVRIKSSLFPGASGVYFQSDDHLLDEGVLPPTTKQKEGT